MIASRDMTGLYVVNPRANEILLQRRGKSAMFDSEVCIPAAGGHFEAEDGGDPYRCVIRELMEETGLDESAFSEIRLRYVAFRLADGELRKNYYFFAEFKCGSVDLPRSNEGLLAWVKVEEIEALPMPVSAKPCLVHYFSLGARTDAVYCAAVGVDGVVVTEL
jgi:ADP-ribose pyrophosphatase